MKNTQTSSGNKNGILLSEINVTPFVDVMLVLLIIFMITAPMLQQGMDISLPKTKAVGAKISNEPFILKIKKDQKIYIGDRSVDLNGLSEKLKALFEYKQEKAIYLQADESIPYGIVAKTLGEIKSSGIGNVSLITSVK